MSVGWALSIVSIVLFVASFLCGGKDDFARFQDDPTGSMSSSMSREKGCFVLDGSGQLKWRSADSVPDAKSQEQSEHKVDNDVDVEAGESKPEDSSPDTKEQE